jgi:DNA topoisomerase-3
LNCFGIAEVSKDLLHELLTGELHRTAIRLGSKNYGVALVQTDRGFYNLEFDKANATAVTIGVCPECGKAVVETKKGFGCSGYKDNGCKFTIWKEDLFLTKYGVTVTAEMARDFLNGRSTKVQGLVDPQDQSQFAGELELYKNGKGYWGIKIIRREKEQKNG